MGRLLEDFELADAARKPVSTYSGGMRRRLDLAISMIGRPRLLFLDEPTTGLDPRSREQLWGTVQGLADQGVTVSPIIDEHALPNFAVTTPDGYSICFFTQYV